MSRKTFVYDHAAGKVVRKDTVSRASAAPSVIGDIQDVRSAIDGRVYSSRRHYRDHVKAHGCEIVGNDWNNLPMDRVMPDVPNIEADIKRAMEE